MTAVIVELRKGLALMDGVDNHVTIFICMTMKFRKHFQEYMLLTISPTFPQSNAFRLYLILRIQISSPIARPLEIVAIIWESGSR